MAPAMALGIVVALLSGCGSDDKPKQALATANVQAARIVADAQRQAQNNLDDARQSIQSAQADAKATLAGIRQNISDARGRLRNVRSEQSQARSRLSKLQGEVSGARRQAARNTFAGTGTFIVGTDVAPGTYRAQTSSGCYWARLASLDTSNINDNDNADGPVVIQILPSDKAIQVSDCGDFHKVG